MYAAVNSISVPFIDLSKFGVVRSFYDLGIEAGRLMASYVYVLNSENIISNILIKEEKLEKIVPGSYFYVDDLNFRTLNISRHGNPEGAWEKGESLIYHKFTNWCLKCMIDPKWITTSTSFIGFRRGSIRQSGLLHINSVNPDKKEVYASPLFLGVKAVRGF